jgi:carboxymethylenebutenolidase
MARVLTRIQTLDRRRSYGDLRAAIDWTRAQRPERPVVMLGICFGGPFALVAAADGIVDGVVTWHGTRMQDYVARAAEMSCPMRLHFGGIDPIVPPDAVAAVRAAFSGRDDVHIVVHDGATHGYSHRAAAEAYAAAAEQASMAAACELVATVGTL